MYERMRVRGWSLAPFGSVSPVNRTHGDTVCQCAGWQGLEASKCKLPSNGDALAEGAQRVEMIQNSSV